MKFIYDRANRQIISDNPEIWVEDCGMDRERGVAFVLHLEGKSIGFREPDEQSEFDIGKDDGSLTWTIGEIGDYVRGWDAVEKTMISKASRYRFCNLEEQERVVDLIRKAMSTYTGIFEEGKISAVHVSFSSHLEIQLASGELIVE